MLVSACVSAEDSVMECAPNSRGFTLAEVTVAMVLTALLATVASQPFSRGGLSALEAESAANEIALTLQSFRNQAILTGIERGVRFVKRSGKITQIAPYQVVNGRRQRVDTIIEVDPQIVTIASRLAGVGFTPEGLALQGGQINVSTSQRNWRIDVISLTGAVHVMEP